MYAIHACMHTNPPSTMFKMVINGKVLIMYMCTLSLSLSLNTFPFMTILYMADGGFQLIF